jgi:hypothetical protein
MSVDAQTARRSVTAWLVSQVGNMLMGGTPQLVISHQTLWRVPVMLTSSNQGTIGQVGTVDVNAENGDMLVSPELQEQIKSHAQDLVRWEK